MYTPNRGTYIVKVEVNFRLKFFIYLLTYLLVHQILNYCLIIINFLISLKMIFTQVSDT